MGRYELEKFQNNRISRIRSGAVMSPLSVPSRYEKDRGQYNISIKSEYPEKIWSWKPYTCEWVNDARFNSQEDDSTGSCLYDTEKGFYEPWKLNRLYAVRVLYSD